MDNVKYISEWKSPFTNKRYLHPPFAENMFTMWPELRVICGDIVEITHGYRSSGFRILVGKDLVSPDFSEVNYEVRPDGAPIHVISQNIGDYTIRMESFCNIERIPTCYTEFTLSNNTSHEISDIIALLPRTGREDHLVGTEVDGYAHYDSNVHNWGFLLSNWRQESNLLTDDDYEILLQGISSFDSCWQGDVPGLLWYQRHLLKMAFTLKAGETKTFRCAFRHGKVAKYDYEAEKVKALAFWNGELKRLKRSPGGKEYSEMVNSVVLQCLQMFAYPVGKDYVLPRQGGLQRVIWPVEAMEFLMALDRLGDFADYTQTAYETYFLTLQVKEGEDAGAVQNLSGQRWGCITGGSTWGCARHLLFRDSREAFDLFRDSLYLGFRWMEKQRNSTRNGEYPGVGIFPPMKATDWPGVFQSWTFTDAINLMGYYWLAEAFEHFNDPAAAEVRAAYDDYMTCMRQVLEEQLPLSIGDEEELFITTKVGERPLDPPAGPERPEALAFAHVIDPKSDLVRRMENYRRNRGIMRNGLTDQMHDCVISPARNANPWAGHTWYTSMFDMYWFYIWMERGEKDKAWETLSAQFKWGMSKEYYLLERYADNDPYWTPWMPNASANGRLLMMMADYFEE